MVKRLKVFFKYCREVERLSLHPEVAGIKAVYLEMEKIFLSWEELEKLAAAELPDHQAKVRDCYLFACYTGLRYSDMDKLTPKHITEVNGMKVMSFVMVKSGKKPKKVAVALNDLAWYSPVKVALPPLWCCLVNQQCKWSLMMRKNTEETPEAALYRRSLDFTSSHQALLKPYCTKAAGEP